MRIFRTHIKIGLISISVFARGQEINGNYIFISNIRPAPTFVTKLKLRADSTFKYSFKGDLFNDQAEGIYSITDNIIKLEYQTPDKYRDTVIIEKYINTDPPTVVETKEVITWPDPITYLRPVELMIKKNTLIVISTTENPNERKKNRKFKFKKYEQ